MKKLMSWFEEIDDSEVKDYIDMVFEYDGEKIDEDEAYSRISQDADRWDILWKDEMDYLTELMNEKNPKGYWKARVDNFGWRNLSGSKYFRAENGSELYDQLLPNTDNHFHIYKYRNGFAIQNYHHDSPTGNEWYYIVPCAESTYEREA